MHICHILHIAICKICNICKTMCINRGGRRSSLQVQAWLQGHPRPVYPRPPRRRGTKPPYIVEYECRGSVAEWSKFRVRTPSPPCDEVRLAAVSANLVKSKVFQVQPLQGQVYDSYSRRLSRQTRHTPCADPHSIKSLSSTSRAKLSRGIVRSLGTLAGTSPCHTYPWHIGTEMDK